MNEGTGIKAGLRDASWYATPGRARVYHVVNGDKPACNSNAVLIDEYSVCDAGTVPKHLRCHRPGCRQAWPSTED